MFVIFKQISHKMYLSRLCTVFYCRIPRDSTRAWLHFIHSYIKIILNLRFTILNLIWFKKYFVLSQSIIIHRILPEIEIPPLFARFVLTDAEKTRYDTQNHDVLHINTKYVSYNMCCPTQTQYVTDKHDVIHINMIW